MPGTWTISRARLTGQTQEWSAYLLGRNAYGTWLYTPMRAPAEHPTGRSVETATSGSMQLVAPDSWWVATWWEDGSITVDITTPADVDTASVRYLDLGVRVWADSSGAHGVAGRDVLVEAQAAGLLTFEQVSAARAAAAEVDRQLAARAEPFGDAGWRWFSGIRRNELHVVAYDPSWPAKFDTAREEMLPLLPPGSRVEHVGSTSVPGLPAKDCLDIAVVVPRQEQFEDVIDRLESVGYEGRRDAFGDDPGHVFLRRLAGGRRTHHLHLYHDGHPNLIGVLAFRDLLRTDPEARQRYEAVKLALAEAAPFDRGGYAAGKDAVTADLLRLALARSERPAPPAATPHD
jgi:GrpB-like predicted nucleotidyltransferase (UPF0157 family)